MNQLSTFWNAPRQHWLRRALFQVHLWVALIFGTLIALVSVTGAIVVFRVEMNRMTTPGTAYVKSEAQRLPLDTLIAAVLKVRPDDGLRNVSMEAGPDVAWNVRTSSQNGHRFHNFVDQYRGVVVGSDDYGLNLQPDIHTKFLQWMWDLHANLLAGKTGRLVNGFVAVGALVLSLSGLILWWPGRKLLRFGFTYLFGGSWKRQNYDLHKLTGFYSFAFLALVSFTGAYFSFPDIYRDIATRLSNSTRTAAVDCCGEDGPPAKTSLSDRQVRFEDYLTIAERAMPGYHAVFMSFPYKSGMSVDVKLKGANDWHRVGLSNVYLEPATGKVIAVDSFAGNSPATKFIKLMLPLHFGRFGERFGLGAFGLYAVMVIYVIVGLAAGALMVTGYLMYWNRYLSKRARRWLAFCRLFSTSKVEGTNAHC